MQIGLGRGGMSLSKESQDLTTMMIKVRKTKPLGDYRLMVEFSDDTVASAIFPSSHMRRG